MQMMKKYNFLQEYAVPPKMFKDVAPPCEMLAQLSTMQKRGWATSRIAAAESAGWRLATDTVLLLYYSLQLCVRHSTTFYNFVFYHWPLY